MTACLSDYTLWSLSEGSGTAEERAHRERCRLCATRASRLSADMRAIVTVLHDEPPLIARPAPSRLSALRVVAVAAVLVAAIGVSFLARRPPAVTGDPGEDGFAALGEMSNEVFDEGDPMDASNAADDVVSALAAAAPCEWQPGGCQDIGQPLF